MMVPSITDTNNQARAAPVDISRPASTCLIGLRKTQIIADAIKVAVTPITTAAPCSCRDPPVVSGTASPRLFLVRRTNDRGHTTPKLKLTRRYTILRDRQKALPQPEAKSHKPPRPPDAACAHSSADYPM